MPRRVAQEVERLTLTVGAFGDVDGQQALLRSVVGDGGPKGLLEGLANVSAWNERLCARPARVRTDVIGA